MFQSFSETQMQWLVHPTLHGKFNKFLCLNFVSKNKNWIMITIHRIKYFRVVCCSMNWELTCVNNNICNANWTNSVQLFFKRLRNLLSYGMLLILHFSILHWLFITCVLLCWVWYCAECEACIQCVTPLTSSTSHIKYRQHL